MRRTDIHTIIGKRGKRTVVERKRPDAWNTLHLDAPRPRRFESEEKSLVEERVIGLESENKALRREIDRRSQRITALEAENRNLKRAAADRLVQAYAEVPV